MCWCKKNYNWSVFSFGWLNLAPWRSSQSWSPKLKKQSLQAHSLKLQTPTTLILLSKTNHQIRLQRPSQIQSIRQVQWVRTCNSHIFLPNYLPFNSFLGPQYLFAFFQFPLTPTARQGATTLWKAPVWVQCPMRLFPWLKRLQTAGHVVTLVHANPFYKANIAALLVYSPPVAGTCFFGSHWDLPVALFIVY